MTVVLDWSTFGEFSDDAVLDEEVGGESWRRVGNLPSMESNLSRNNVTSTLTWLSWRFLGIYGE